MSPLQFSSLSTACLLTLAALLGLGLGSFCNAWAWRLVHGESITRGRSHCVQCGHTLSVQDLAPLASYVCLKGRCRYCGAAIPWRYPAAEAVSALFFVSVFLGYGAGLTAVRLAALGCLLLVLSLVDWEIREIPDGLLLAAALLALLRLPVEGRPGLFSALLGGVAVSVPLLGFVLAADRVMGRETMGGGDLKLFAVLGLHFGPAQTLLLLILSCLLGLLLGGWMRRRNRGEQIPFGPAVSLAGWLVMLFGAQALGWYLSLFSWQ